MPPTPCPPPGKYHDATPYDRPPTRAGSGSGSGSGLSSGRRKKPSKPSSSDATTTPNTAAKPLKDIAKVNAPVSQPAETARLPTQTSGSGKSGRKRSRELSRLKAAAIPPQADPAVSITPTTSSLTATLTQTKDDVLKSPMNGQAPFPIPLSVSTTATSNTSALPSADKHSPLKVALKEHKSKEEKLKKLRSKIKALEDKREAQTRQAEEAEKRLEEAARRIEELEKEVERQKEEINAKTGALGKHEEAGELLREAVQCGVCMDTLNDPHILSCGHIACKECLRTWFRTPGAYLHEPPNSYPVIPSELDLSHRSKTCHVCRSIILRRPTRMFHLGGILGPLGIDSRLPSASQEQSSGDPWALTFPIERSTYRVWDDADGVARCPECGCEIDGGMCSGCGVEFSGDEDEESVMEDWSSEDEEMLARDEEIAAPGPRRPNRRHAIGTAGAAARRLQPSVTQFVDPDAMSDGEDSDECEESDDIEVMEMPSDRRRRVQQEDVARIPAGVQNVMDAFLAGAGESSDEDDMDGNSDGYRVRGRIDDDQPVGGLSPYSVQRRARRADASSIQRSNQSPSLRNRPAMDVNESESDSADGGHSETDLDQYEDSFIDDDDSRDAEEAESEMRHAFSDDDSSGEEEKRVEGGGEDEPTLEELRRRRLDRLDPLDRARNTDADANGSMLLRRLRSAESPGVARRPTRRTNTIILSDSE